MSSDHLWPARPGYLRRGTPVIPCGEGLPYVVIEIDDDDLLLVSPSGGGGWKAAHAVYIDLRDPTARAHAAWAYCEIDRQEARPIVSDPRLCEGGIVPAMLHGLLLRMASGDPSITVSEARAALEWAEGIEDAARETSEHVHGIVGAAAQEDDHE